MKENPFGVEHATVRFGRETMSAVGVAIGTDPSPYRLDYRLETRRGFVTSRLLVESRGEGWRNRIHLRRSARGVWTLETRREGAAALPAAGDDPGLADALDCDLDLSPLTNTLLVLRHHLLASGGPVDFVVAWVSVPDLVAHRSEQRYTFLRRDVERSVVRFEDTDGFAADIVFDSDGLVVEYPGLARRL